MTRDEIEALSGEDLRVAVAERVFGHEVSYHVAYFIPGRLGGEVMSLDEHACYAEGDKHYLIPAYESDIAAAFAVVEHLFASGLLPHQDIHIEHFDHYGEEPATWNVSTCQSEDGWEDWTEHESLPAAICRAALLAVEEAAQ